MEQDCVNAGTIAKLCDKIQKLESERDALKAHVERLRGVIDYCMSYLAENRLNTIGSWSKAHKELRHALESTPQQNLNALKREVAKEAFVAGFSKSYYGDMGQPETEDVIMSCARLCANNYTNTKYPSDKEGE